MTDVTYRTSRTVFDLAALGIAHMGSRFVDIGMTRRLREAENEQASIQHDIVQQHQLEGDDWGGDGGIN